MKKIELDEIIQEYLIETRMGTPEFKGWLIEILCKETSNTKKELQMIVDSFVFSGIAPFVVLEAKFKSETSKKSIKEELEKILKDNITTGIRNLEAAERGLTEKSPNVGGGIH